MTDSISGMDHPGWRDKVGAKPESLLNSGGWGNGDVYVARRGDRRVILKTYLNKSAAKRRLGRLLIAREKRAYDRLAGLPGIPMLLDCDDQCSLVMEEVSGRMISTALRSRPESRGKIIDSLRVLVAAMHSRDVFHLDLRNQGNVLVDDDDQAVLLDFASAVIVPRQRWLMAPVRPALRRFDEYGFSKWEQMASS